MSDSAFKQLMVLFVTVIISLFFTCFWVNNHNLKMHPSYEGDFMVSGLTGEGTLENTIQTNEIIYNVEKKTWECVDKNNGEVYYYKDNILIERVYQR